jgi:O-antigen ligase
VALTIYTIFNGNNRYYFFNEWLNIQPQLLSEIKVVRSSYNTPGAALGIAIPFFFAMAIFLRRSRLRYIIIGILVVFSIFLFLIGSGGGWLSAFAGSVFVLACWKLWTLSFSLPVLGFATWVTISSLSKTSSLAKTWIAKMFPISSVTSRFQYWGETINLLQGHVLTGVGIGVWFELYPHGKWPVINPHNNYLQVFSDTGLFGIIAMLGAAVAFVYICYTILHSSTKNNCNGIAIGIIGSILAGMVNAFHEVNTSAAIVSGKSITNYIAIPYIWFLAAFLVVVYYRIKPEHVKKAIEQASQLD